MIRLDKFFYISLFFYFALGCLLFFSFYPLLLLDPITSYDDKLLLDGIEKIRSINGYFASFLSGKILDIQPIRDLSYFFDFKIIRIFNFHSFHLTNLLIWIGICCLFKKILDLLSKDYKINQVLIWSIVFLYAFSPVSTSSIAWIAARKHLLSTLFTLWATFIFLKNRHCPYSFKNIWSILLLYLLAGLSQPINILWPVFVVVYSYFDKKLMERKFFLVSLGIIGVVVLILNFYYYDSLYLEISGGDGKYDSQLGIGLSLLALGRYFFLVLLPFDSLPVSHFQGSWKNLLGLVFLVLFIFYCYKKSSLKPILYCYIIYFFLPLIPVTFKITRIFCSDTYLLNASLGIYISFFKIFEEFKFKKLYIFIFVYAGVLFYYNLDYVKVFLTTDSIWQYSYKHEPGPMSIVNLANNKINEGKYSEAGYFLDQLEILGPENRFYIKLRADVISKNPAIIPSEKIRMLEALIPKKPIIFLELALLYSNAGNKEEFKKNVIDFFSNAQSYIENSYFDNEKVLALVKVGCEKNQIELECKKYFEDFSRKVIFKNWNKNKYEKLYNELKVNPEKLIY